MKNENYISYFNEYELLSFLEQSSEKLILLKINKMFKSNILKLNKEKTGILFKKKNYQSKDKYYNIIKNYIEEYPNNNFKNVIATLKYKRAFKVTEKIGHLLDKKIKESKQFFHLRVYVFIATLFYASYVISRLILGLTREKEVYYIFIFILITAGIMYFTIYRFFNNKIKSIFINIISKEINTSEFIDDYLGANNNEIFDANLLLLIGSNELNSINLKPSNNWNSCSTCSSGGGGDGCSSCSSCGGCGGCGD